MMEKPTHPHKPYLGTGRKYVDYGPTLGCAINFAANAVVQLREEGGEDTDGAGHFEPVDERVYARGLIRLFMGRFAPQDDGRNCSRGDISVQIERVMSLAYRIGKEEAAV